VQECHLRAQPPAIGAREWILNPSPRAGGEREGPAKREGGGFVLGRR